MAVDETTAETRANPSSQPGFVVAFGASAGALEALRTLLGGLAVDTGATFVVVVHGSPTQSHLAELLEPYCALPIREVAADAPLEPNTVLVVSPKANVRAIDSHLRLAASPVDERRQRGRIDGAFRALAAARDGHGVGVVLTGAGTDGALGLGQVKHEGGLTIAQDPVEAEHGGMPRAAIEAGIVDLVLPLRKVGAAIARYCRTDPHLSAARRESGDGDETRFAELVEVAEARTGHDFSAFRQSHLAHRIGKRMRLHAIDTWPRYLELLHSDAAEAAALAKDVMLNVTEFFFHEKAFERLENDVLPRLFALKTSDRDTLRAWVVGCSTGEQAYSLAIALTEERALRDIKPRLQVFASDLAEDALRRARMGFYPAEIAGSMSQERLKRFFVRDDDRGYRVRAGLRNLVVFAAHDVVRDFPFSQLDLVVCRSSMLDSLKPEVRRSVLRNFHYALRPHGLLIVDSDVALEAEAPELFSRDGLGGIYRRQAGVALPLSRPPAPFRLPAEPVRKQVVTSPRLLHLGMLERYAPASVLIDAEGNVLHYSARAGRFLRLPGGELTHDLLQLLREPLRSAVRAGIEAIDQQAGKWSSDALLVHTEHGVSRVAVHVESAEVNAKLVVLAEVAPGEIVDGDDRRLTANDYTAVLESELEEAGRRLRAVIAAQDDDKERGPARAHDGELAHVLGDLESAQEEVRSVNEELLSLNQDNRTRVEELARLSADLEVLLESTGLATLFLDRELKVVRFTPPLLEIFQIMPADKGKPLAELNHRLRKDDFLGDARRVLKHSVPIEREVEADNGKWYLVRMLPYRSAPQGLHGIAITLVDITSRKKAELELRQADRRKDEFIALLAHELRNPLAPISSGIEILKRRDLDPAIAERVTLTMGRQAAQLVRLIDDLLDVSRISSGRLQLRKAPAALADIVRDAIAAVRPLIERAHHELTVDVPREPILLEADAARLTQVIANLLNNAARYTPAGGHIAISVRRDGTSAEVTVRDNGYGIAAEALPHVFEMFYQGADPRAATQTGLGIGLALVRSLVNMHGGTISASSAGLDRGSEFTLRLPMLSGAAANDSPAQPDSEKPLGGHRVLVVDDNADAAQTLAVLIQTLGANDVHVAFSGREALPLAERIRPDTVFLDLKMAEMDGYEVAHRLRREPWGGDAWLVALTGWGLDEHKRRTKDAGFDQHLTKPANRTELEAILSRPAVSRA